MIEYKILYYFKGKLFLGNSKRLRFFQVLGYKQTFLTLHFSKQPCFAFPLKCLQLSAQSTQAILEGFSPPRFKFLCIDQANGLNCIGTFIIKILKH